MRKTEREITKYSYLTNGVSREISRASGVLVLSHPYEKRGVENKTHASIPCVSS